MLRNEHVNHIFKKNLALPCVNRAELVQAALHREWRGSINLATSFDTEVVCRRPLTQSKEGRCDEMDTLRALRRISI